MPNEIVVKSCDEIMLTVYKPPEFIVDKLITRGLFILAGAPKVGKSWLALDICLSVARGENVLERETHRGDVLYLCLEDSYARIQNRLYELTDEPADGLYFAIISDNIGNGLETQIENFKKKHPGLSLVVIDTLQKVRERDETGYGSDYRELSSLKSLADRLGITLMIVHHTRKSPSSDPFNQISGTTGITGCADGSMVLIERERGSRQGKLYCVGRDIENQEISISFEDGHWNATGNTIKTERDVFPFEIHDFLTRQIHFSGTASNLCDMMYQMFGRKYFPNRITRDLLQHVSELIKLGVSFEFRRSHGNRFLDLNYSLSGDSSEGRMLWVEVVESTVTDERYEDTSINTEDSDLSEAECYAITIS